MLHASDYNVMDMKLPLIGAIADRFGGLDCSSDTEVFTSCVDVINLKYRRGRGSGWTENEF